MLLIAQLHQLTPPAGLHCACSLQAPACGGPTRSELSEDERANDTVARYGISQELGHEREQITAVYLGR